MTKTKKVIFMNILGMGKDYTTGQPLINPIDVVEFSKKILASFPHETLPGLADASRSAFTFKKEVERDRYPDLGNPREVGWTFLVNSNDPQRDEIIKTLQPLAKHRNMKDPNSPLMIDFPPDSGINADWYWWLEENYKHPDIEKPPHYILLVGGPEYIPFHFQSFLDIAASVGRVAFDSIKDLQTYVEKIIRLETADSPVIDREVLYFATDEGSSDPTYYSCLYMATPLADYSKNTCKFRTHKLMKDDATKEKFIKLLKMTKPSLIYTASHGVGAPQEDLETQKKYNGAICCQPSPGQSFQESLFSGEDIPLNRPFLEGSIFFQFACFSYGTPRRSDFAHWLGDQTLNSKEDFIAALPKKLIAHPKGPIAYIGHVDTAWLHSFADPDHPMIIDRWHSRILPFKKAVEVLLNVQPIGLAMESMNEAYNFGNQRLTSIWDYIERGRYKMNPERHSRLVDTFIKRSDAQNYMIFGDPAVRLRIPVS